MKADWPELVVTRVRRERSISGSHEHVSAVLTGTGAYLTRDDLIHSLDGGEAWWTSSNGARARIRKVPHCHYAGCSLTPYVSTAPHHTPANDIERLPSW